VGCRGLGPGVVQGVVAQRRSPGQGLDVLSGQADLGVDLLAPGLALALDSLQVAEVAVLGGKLSFEAETGLLVGEDRLLVALTLGEAIESWRVLRCVLVCRQDELLLEPGDPLLGCADPLPAARCGACAPGCR